MMENQELMKAVGQYLSYWRTHVQPLADKEPRRYTHFKNTLRQVGRRLYGPEFSLEFSVAVLYSVFEYPARSMPDGDNPMEP